MVGEHLWRRPQLSWVEAWMIGNSHPWERVKQEHSRQREQLKENSNGRTSLTYLTNQGIVLLLDRIGLGKGEWLQMRRERWIEDRSCRVPLLLLKVVDSILNILKIYQKRIVLNDMWNINCWGWETREYTLVLSTKVWELEVVTHRWNQDSFWGQSQQIVLIEHSRQERNPG